MFQRNYRRSVRIPGTSLKVSRGVPEVFQEVSWGFSGSGNLSRIHRRSMGYKWAFLGCSRGFREILGFQRCYSGYHMASGDFKNISEGFIGFSRAFLRCFIAKLVISHTSTRKVQILMQPREVCPDTPWYKESKTHAPQRETLRLYIEHHDFLRE